MRGALFPQNRHPRKSQSFAHYLSALRSRLVHAGLFQLWSTLEN
jgi:hypothetical protein